MPHQRMGLILSHKFLWPPDFLWILCLLLVSYGFSLSPFRTFSVSCYLLHGNSVLPNGYFFCSQFSIHGNLYFGFYKFGCPLPPSYAIDTCSLTLIIGRIFEHYCSHAQPSSCSLSSIVFGAYSDDCLAVRPSLTSRPVSFSSSSRRQ